MQNAVARNAGDKLMSMISSVYTRLPGKYPETEHLYANVGTWTIIDSALRAKAIRTSGKDEDRLGEEARTGLYVPGVGFDWTQTPIPPAYVKDEAFRIVRARRKEIGLPV